MNETSKHTTHPDIFSRMPKSYLVPQAGREILSVTVPGRGGTNAAPSSRADESGRTQGRASSNEFSLNQTRTGRDR